MSNIKSLLKKIFKINQILKGANIIDPGIQKIDDYRRENLNENYPHDFTFEETKLIDFVKNYTMTSPERMVSLLRAVDYIVNADIKGDIVECGVWYGGSMMLVASKLLQLGSGERRLFLFDTFDGMS